MQPAGQGAVVMFCPERLYAYMLLPLKSIKPVLKASFAKPAAALISTAQVDRNPAGLNTFMSLRKYHLAPPAGSAAGKIVLRHSKNLLLRRQVL